MTPSDLALEVVQTCLVYPFLAFWVYKNTELSWSVRAAGLGARFGKVGGSEALPLYHVSWFAMYSTVSAASGCSPALSPTRDLCDSLLLEEDAVLETISCIETVRGEGQILPSPSALL